jgi:hypothetical protein
VASHEAVPWDAPDLDSPPQLGSLAAKHEDERRRGYRGLEAVVTFSIATLSTDSKGRTAANWRMNLAR